MKKWPLSRSQFVLEGPALKTHDLGKAGHRSQHPRIHKGSQMPGVMCDVQVPTKANLEAGEPGAGVPNPDWVLGVYDLGPGGPWAFQTL